LDQIRIVRSFRFVHAADIHLDSPLKGLVGQEGNAVALIRSATREAFDALIGRTIEEEAAFLIIAGDLYDGEWRDYQTGLFFVRQMGRLRQAGIPAYLIHGNHDAESQITRRLTLPDNVTVFPTRRPKTCRIEALGVALHGQGFRQRDIDENLARSYPSPVPGALNIGILHTGLAGEEGHAPYAPCTLDELVQKGYDYWALGHIHQPSVRHKRPYIVYPGNVQGRHIRETGPRGAVLGTVEEGEIAEVKPFHVDIVRWELVEVSANGCASIQDISDRIRECIERAVSERADGRMLACRIRVSGRTEAHAKALAAREKLLAEAKAAAAGLGEERAWVEKVVIETAPETGRTNAADLASALGDITSARHDETLIRDLRNSVGGLVSKLPPEVRNEPEDPLLRKAINGDYEALIELAGPYAMARVLGNGD
jgi:DNA repair exonuclease SbcCD nuclease subunit